MLLLEMRHVATASHGNRTVEVQAIWTELSRRFMSLRNLAVAAGIHPQTLANSMARGLPSPRCRLKVENLLGIPIFSSAPEFTRRQELIRRFGEDPNLITFRRLYRRAVRARIKGRAVAKSKAALIELLASHLSAAVPRPTPPPPTQTLTPPR